MGTDGVLALLQGSRTAFRIADAQGIARNKVSKVFCHCANTERSIRHFDGLHNDMDAASAGLACRKTCVISFQVEMKKRMHMISFLSTKQCAFRALEVLGNDCAFSFIMLILILTNDLLEHIQMIFCQKDASVSVLVRR